MKIVGIAGKKQSGKSTTANILHGIILKKQSLIKDFNIGNDGKLIILTTDSNGKEGWGEFDIARKDSDFTEYAEHNVWPYIKLYSFADNLKSMCVEFFGLTPAQVYGTDEQKNTETHIQWKDMPFIPDSRWIVTAGAARSANMTAREFMQYFGTNVMRQMYGPIWVDHAIHSILREQTKLAIVADVRFPNEVDAITDAGGIVVRLTRRIRKDEHPSETALDDYDFTHCIDNRGGVDALMDQVKSFYQKL